MGLSPRFTDDSVARRLGDWLIDLLLEYTPLSSSSRDYLALEGNLDPRDDCSGRCEYRGEGEGEEEDRILVVTHQECLLSLINLLTCSSPNPYPSNKAESTEPVDSISSVLMLEDLATNDHPEMGEGVERIVYTGITASRTGEGQGPKTPRCQTNLDTSQTPQTPKTPQSPISDIHIAKDVLLDMTLKNTCLAILKIWWEDIDGQLVPKAKLAKWGCTDHLDL